MKKATWNKRLSTLISSIAMVCCLFAAAILTACNNEQPVAQSGEEAGVYYYDDRGEQSLLTLGESLTYTLAIGGDAFSGSYTLEGETLTLTQTDGKTMTASLSGDVITLTYEDTQMRFLRKVYYTVTFDSAGGSNVESVSVLNGKSIQKPASDPVRDGFVFLGWYTDEAYTAPYLFGAQALTGDTTLYARWAQPAENGIEYTISYDLGYDGETIAPTQTVGGKLYSPALPAAREGYSFVGWWVSMENKADRLSYRFEAPSASAEGTLFDADTTLFAVWQAEDAQVASPAVSVSQQAITWDSVGAAAYLISVTAPDGTPLYSEQRTTSTTFPVTFDEAGAYRVQVTAINAGGTQVAEPTVRYYMNHALARVSGVRVIEPNALVFRGVEHAEKYLITIDCGDDAHVHTLFDNGTSLYYNFSNCEMQEGGIVFTIRAVADGYAASETTFVFDRTLGETGALSVTDDVFTWNAVPGATYYTVRAGEAEYDVFGTQFSLKTLPAGNYTLSVVPRAKGFNSPAAAQIAYSKETPALPAEIGLLDMTLSWSKAEEGAVYTLLVNGQEIAVEAGARSYDLTDLFTWTDGADYTLQLRVEKNGAIAVSDVFTFRCNALDENVVYDGGVLSWKPVAGAQRYEIRLNGDDASIITVEDGSAEYLLPSLARAGENTIEVRFVNGNYTSEWAQTSVYAHAIVFDTRGGSAVDPLYKAVGDRVELPLPAAKEGYDFAAWYNTPNGPESNGAKYDEPFFVASGELVLYAYYTPKAITVTLSGAEGMESETVYYGEDFTLPVPQSDNATSAFGGWFSAPYGAGVAYTDAYGNSVAPWDIAEDGVTLYAFWVDAVLNYTAIGSGYAVSAGARINLVSSITIPAEYNGAKVTQITGSAFANCASLQKIDLPDTIELIATATAFTGCTALEAVNVYDAGATSPRYSSQDGVLFDSGSADAPHALRPAYIPSAKTGTYRIPDGVDVIPRAAFAGSMIEKVIIPVSVSAIEAEAFADCANLSSVVFESLGARASGLTIGERAFMNCELLTSITLPARLTQIALDKYVLRGNSFNSVSELTENAPDAFLGCTSLASVDVAQNASAAYSSKDGVLLSDSGRTLAYFPADKSTEGFVFPATVRTIAAGAFLGCYLSDALVIPASVTQIGDFAFADTSITDLTFESDGIGLSAVTVGNYAFYGCDDLETLTFAEGSNVTEIGNGAFKGCSYLESLVLPASMTFIGDEAFAECGTDAWSFSVTLPESDKQLSLGNGVFSGCEIGTLNIPANVAVSSDFFSGIDADRIVVDPGNPYIESSVDGGVLYLKGSNKTLLLYLSEEETFVVPDDVTAIAAYAFSGNSSVENITIPASVTSIGAHAFDGCHYLESVTFAGAPQSLSIGEYAFYGTALRALDLPECPVTIGDYAFASIEYYDYETYDDASIRSLDLGGTTSIGNYAFYRTGTKLDVVIPASVTSIGAHAFEGYGWSMLTDYIQSLTFAEGSALQTIGAYAFYKANLTSFNVPASVTSIGAYAFADINTLTSFTFEEGTAPLSFGTAYDDPEEGYVTGRVLDGTPITAVHFPGRMTVLCAQAFYYNDTVEEVTFGDQYEGFTASRLTTIGESAFHYADALETIVIPASITNTDVIAIGNNAFYGSGLTSVTFEAGGSGTVTIGESAFYSCNGLTEITLPATLGDFTANGVTIPALANGTGVFPELYDDERGLAAVNVAEGNALYASKDGILYTSDFRQLVYCPPAKTGSVEVDARAERIGANAFRGCALLERITFAAGSACVEIGAGAFSGCVRLSDIVLPDTVQVIGTDAFLSCDALTSFRVPDALNSFSIEMLGCENLTELVVGENNRNYSSADGVLFSKDGATLLYYLPTRTDVSYSVPAGTVEIAEEAFAGNTSLERVNFPASLEHIGVNAFNGCTALSEVTFADGTAQLIFGNNAFYRTALERIELPARVGALGDSVFENTDLSEIVFAEGSTLTSLGDRVFANTELVSVTLPIGVRTIGDNLFGSCTSLESVVLPEGLTTLGNGTFYRCSALRSVNIPSTLRTLGTATFEGCSALTNVLFAADAQIATLSSDTFTGCTALEEIELPASLTEIAGADSENSSSRGLFEGLTSLRRVTFAEGSRCLTIGESAFEESGLESFTIPSSVTTIGRSAFAYTALTEIAIPRTVTRLGDYAFSGCRNLAEVRIDAGITQIPAYAFQSCASLVSISIPASVTAIDATAFAGCSQLATVTLDQSNPAFKLEDGVLYNADMTQIVFIPAALQTFTVPANMVNSDLVGLLSAVAGLREVVVENGNPVYRAAFGALYDSEWNLLFVPAAMTEFTIPKEVTLLPVQDANYNSLFAGKAIETIGYEADRTQPLEIMAGGWGQGVFVGLESLTDVSLPDNTVIGSYAFYHCANLVSVTFGAGTGSIGQYAFAGTGLTALTLTEGFTAVGNYAFQNCTQMKSLSLPASLTSIASSAFSGCSIETIELAQGSTSFVLENNVLYNADKTQIILVSSALTTYVVPANMTGSAFLDVLKSNPNLQSVTVEAGNPNYRAAEGALYDMDWNLVFIPSGMTTFTVPANITVDDAFLSDLGDALEGSSVSAIAFAGDVSGYRTAFGAVYDTDWNLVLVPAGMTTFTIPKEVTLLEADGLFDGTAVTTIDFEEGGTQPLAINGYSYESVFGGADDLTTVSLPARAVLGDYAFCYMDGITTVTLEEGITAIGYRAFYECTGIRELVIPASVKTVGEDAFRYWESEQTIYLPFAEDFDPTSDWSWNSWWDWNCYATLVYQN